MMMLQPISMGADGPGCCFSDVIDHVRRAASLELLGDALHLRVGYRMRHSGQQARHNLPPCIEIWQGHREMHIKTTRPQHSRINHMLAVRH